MLADERGQEHASSGAHTGKASSASKRDRKSPEHRVPFGRRRRAVSSSVPAGRSNSAKRAPVAFASAGASSSSTAIAPFAGRSGSIGRQARTQRRGARPRRPPEDTREMRLARILGGPQIAAARAGQSGHRSMKRNACSLQGATMKSSRPSAGLDAERQGQLVGHLSSGWRARSRRRASPSARCRDSRASTPAR